MRGTIFIEEKSWEGEGNIFKEFRVTDDHFHRRRVNVGRRIFFQGVEREEWIFSRRWEGEGSIFQGFKSEKWAFSQKLRGSRDHFLRRWEGGGSIF
jgi:hypothetical protein